MEWNKMIMCLVWRPKPPDTIRSPRFFALLPSFFLYNPLSFIVFSWNSTDTPCHRSLVHLSYGAIYACKNANLQEKTIKIVDFETTFAWYKKLRPSCCNCRMRSASLLSPALSHSSQSLFSRFSCIRSAQEYNNDGLVQLGCLFGLFHQLSEAVAALERSVWSFDDLNHFQNPGSIWKSVSSELMMWSFCYFVIAVLYHYFLFPNNRYEWVVPEYSPWSFLSEHSTMSPTTAEKSFTTTFR